MSIDMTIIEAMRDENVFRNYLTANGKYDINTWKNWQVALRCIYGHGSKSESSRELIKQCTGREWSTMPKEGFRNSLLLCGRRSGKSKIAGLLGCAEAVMSGREQYLSPGEQGLVTVISPSRAQSTLVASYITACFETPLLKKEVASTAKNTILLKNGVRVVILCNDWRTCRGYSLLCCIIDEICFLRNSELQVKNDAELIAAIKPALSTTQGKLIGISSPYSKKGHAWERYKANFGNPKGRTLIWQAPSLLMNSATLTQKEVDDAMAEDRASALAEYYAQWRSDVGAFIDLELLEKLIVTGRTSLPPKPGIRFQAFADVSGGTGGDHAALAISHRRDDGKIIIDLARCWRAPHNPLEVIDQMCRILREYRITQCVGDNYSAGFVKQKFEDRGIRYIKCDAPKSTLYLEALPQLCSGGVELLDSKQLIDEFCNLERRTRSGGKDSVDHSPNSHDDLCNAVAGALFLVAKGKTRVGGLTSSF